VIENAYAMGLPGGGAGGGDWSFFIMMGVLFAIFYFLLIRPQMKQQKEHKDMLANLTHGDLVITSGGIQGKVTAIADNVITLEIAEKVRIKVGKSFITAVIQKAGKESKE
jgi:preprotein translocase subunit YajC